MLGKLGGISVGEELQEGEKREIETGRGELDTEAAPKAAPLTQQGQGAPAPQAALGAPGRNPP